MENISTERILNRLDELLSRNDYASAEEHILYWIGEAERIYNNRTKLLLLNELAGLYRKLAKEKEALKTVETLLNLVTDMKIENNIGAATTYINCATVFKAFSKAEEALPLFNKAQHIYETELEVDDERFGALYNNMALALVDLKRFDEAIMWYQKAIKEAPHLRDPYIELALLYYEQQKYQEVYDLIKQALKITNHKKTYINEVFSWNETPYDLLSISCYHLNLLPESLFYLDKAIALNKDNERLLKNKEIIEKILKEK